MKAPVYEVYALKYAGPFQRPAPIVRWLQDMDQTTTVNYYIFAIVGGDGPIIVDCGCSPKLAEEKKLVHYVHPGDVLKWIGIDIENDFKPQYELIPGKQKVISELKKADVERKIGIVLKLSESETGFLLTAQDEDGNIASADMICEKNPARQPDQAIATIRKQLTKFGGTPFDCTDMVIELKQMWFIPVSELNALRRSISEKLLEFFLK